MASGYPIGNRCAGSATAVLVLRGANLSGADLRGANLTSVHWAETTCPDGSNSEDRDSDAFTCEANL